MMQNGDTSELKGGSEQSLPQTNERNRVDEMLQELPLPYRTIFDSMDVGAFIVDTDFRLVLINAVLRQWNEKFGIETDVIGRGLFEIFPFLSDRVRDDYHRVFETGKTLTTEESLEFENSELHCEVRKIPIIEEKRVTGVVTLLRDITEYRLAEDALRKSKERFRALTESTSDWIWEVDVNAVYTYASPKVRDLLGYEPEEIIGKTPFDLMPPEEAERIRAEFEAIAKERRPFERLENQNVHETGRLVWLETSGEPILDQRGELLGYRGIDRDITERKLMEETLERAHQGLERRVEERTAELTAANIQLQQEIAERKRTEQLLQTLNAAALGMERAGTPEQIFSIVGEEFKKVGFTCIVWVTDESQSRLSIEYQSHDSGLVEAVEELMGITARELSVPIDTVEFYRRIVREKETVFCDNVEDITTQIFPGPKRESAREMVGMLNIPKSIDAPLIVDNKVIGTLAVQSEHLSEDDIPTVTAFAHQLAGAWRKAKLVQELKRGLNELRLTQDQLLQAQKMEAIGTLAGGVAHDFNNLLSVIQGYCDLAMMKIGAANPLNGELEQIRATAEHAAKLTRQLLLFSRKQPMEATPLRINRTVEEFLKMLERSLGEDIAIRTDLDPAVWTVRADAGKIEQVIMNLAVNARDAMPGGGTFTIKTENVVLGEADCAGIPGARPGRFVCMSVEDEGVGMDEDVLQRIFEPFYSTKERGIGLGLSVAYGVVEQHGGWMNVHSEPGQGTTFRVYLPAFSLKPVEEAREAESRESLEGRGERILLVEDEERLCDLAAKALRRNGYVVFTARNAKETLDIFEEEGRDFHLIFTDIVLPDITGLQLVDQLLGRNPELRVLLSSGYAERKVQRSVVRARGFRFLQKPYGLLELFRAVRGAVEGTSISP